MYKIFVTQMFLIQQNGAAAICTHCRANKQKKDRKGDLWCYVDTGPKELMMMMMMMMMMMYRVAKQTPWL